MALSIDQNRPQPTAPSLLRGESCVAAPAGARATNRCSVHLAYRFGALVRCGHVGECGVEASISTSHASPRLRADSGSTPRLDRGPEVSCPGLGAGDHARDGCDDCLCRCSVDARGRGRGRCGVRQRLQAHYPPAPAHLPGLRARSRRRTHRGSGHRLPILRLGSDAQPRRSRSIGS